MVRGVEADHVVRKYRSHGPVLPVSMVKHVHWIIRSAIILFGLQSVQLSGSTQIRLGDFFSFLRQEGGQNLEPEILLIPIAVGAPLLHAPPEPTGTCLGIVCQLLGAGWSVERMRCRWWKITALRLRRSRRILPVCPG